MSEPYDLSEPVVAPVLPGTVILRPSLDHAIEAAAADVYLQALGCVRAFGEFHLAMSGGDAHRRLVIRLMTDLNYRDLPWSRTHLWAVRETREQASDSGFAELSELVLEGGGAPADQIHPIAAEFPDADARHDERLRDVLGVREPGHDRLDCVVLANRSLEIEGIDDPLDRLVGTTPGAESVAMTARAVRGGRLVMIVCPGADAEPKLRTYAQQPQSVRVMPTGGELRWYLDHRACGHRNLEEPDE